MATPAKTKLNPNAKPFTFNPAAKPFTFSPKPAAPAGANGASPAPKASPVNTTTPAKKTNLKVNAPVFIPKTSPSTTPVRPQKVAKQPSPAPTFQTPAKLASPPKVEEPASVPTTTNGVEVNVQPQAKASPKPQRYVPPSLAKKRAEAESQPAEADKPETNEQPAAAAPTNDAGSDSDYVEADDSQSLPNSPKHHIFKRTESIDEDENGLNDSIKKYDLDFLKKFQKHHSDMPPELESFMNMNKGLNKEDSFGGGRSFRSAGGSLQRSRSDDSMRGEFRRSMRSPARRTGMHSPAATPPGAKDWRAGPRATPKNVQPPRSGNKSRGRGGRYHDAPMDIEVKPLELSEDRYVPAALKKAEFEPNEQIQRSVKAILNKLTPEKFTTLVQRVVELDISDLGILKDVVIAVFEKALSEPNFSPTYAAFCVELSNELPEFEDPDDPKGKPQNFRRLLLDQCQEEFSNNAAEAKADLAQLDGPEKERRAVKVKQRVLGTIRFIGELFIRGILAFRAVVSCVDILFHGDENRTTEGMAEDIEALCKLFTTVGKKLEANCKKNAQSKEHFEGWFKKLEELSNDKARLDSRRRFAIKDVLELRAHRWIPRREKVQAKTLSEVRKEAIAKQSGGRGGSRPAMRPVSSKISSGGRPPARGRQNRFDRITHKAGDWETVGYGPSKVIGNQDIRKNAPTKVDKAPKEDIRQNAFAALEEDDDDDEEEPEEEEYTDEEQDEEQDEEAEEETKEAKAEETQRLDKKVNALLNEFINANDIKEVVTCVNELNARDRHSLLVTNAVKIALDKGDHERECMDKFLQTMFEQSLLSDKDLETGFADVFEFVDDLTIDVPYAVNHLARLMSPFVHQRTVSMAFLTSSSVDPMRDSGNAGKLVGHILKNIEAKEGKEAMMDLFTSSDLDFTPLMSRINRKPEGVKRFLERMDLESLDL